MTIFPEGWYLYDPEDDGAPIAGRGGWYGPSFVNETTPEPFDDEVTALAHRDREGSFHRAYKRTRPVTRIEAQAIFDMAMARAAVEGA